MSKTLGMPVRLQQILQFLSISSELVVNGDIGTYIIYIYIYDNHIKANLHMPFEISHR